MGFSIDYNIGILGGVFIAILVGAALIVLVMFLTAAKQARDDVVEDEGDDPDLIA